MASRAHYIQDHFGHVSERPRRAVHYYPGREDPVVLPSDRSGSFSGALLASALIASSLIAGGVYALYTAGAPTLSQTEVLPLTSPWELDSEPVRATNIELTARPAHAVPSVASQPVPEETDTPALVGGDYVPVPAPASPATEPAQPAGPDAPRPQPYPDPTTTPPDAIAPPEAGPERPTPLLDPENPYR